MQYDKATTMARDLRAFAAFLEERGDDLPENVKVQPFAWVWGWDEKNVPETMALAARAGLGRADKVEKDYGSNTMNLDLFFGDLKFTIHCERNEVCIKRVVGTKKVKKQVAVGGYEEQEVEEDIVEWDCTPLLAGTKDATGE